MAEKSPNTPVDPYIYIWLDDTIETSKYNRDTKTLIGQMTKGRLLTFADPDQCVDHILTEITTQKLFFIVSNKLGQNVVPLIHEIPQIQTIYVYCGSQQTAESWSKLCPKVSGIFTKNKTLLHQICGDIGACGNDDGLPMSVFHRADGQNSLQKLSEESAKFMWYQSIITVLLLMAKYCNAKTEMIAESRACYHNDEIEKKKIIDFEENYAPTKAFWWYTYDSFVYRLLNKALRTQNIEVIFKFRFFINDLHKQIQQLYQQYLISNTRHCLTLYRGQRMTMGEIQLLKDNVNEVISMNSFLSATTSRIIADIFADTSDQSNAISPLQSVVFIIDICDFDKDTTAFAFIENYSCVKDEGEVLFTIGAIFKVVSVTQNKHEWCVQLQLNKQQNQQHKEFSSYMIGQLGSEPGPLSFGWFLFRTSEFSKAERYAEYIITQLPPDDKETGNAYNLLGLIYKDLKHLEKSVECYQKALKVYSHPNNSKSSQVVAIHYNLGLAYLALGDNRCADEHRQEAALILANSAQTNNPLLIAMTDSLKAKIEIADGKYNSAFKNLETALECKKKELPAEHPSIASTLNEMGVVQEKMGNDDKALKYFQQASHICQKCLSLDHFDLADYCANIGRIYYKRKQYALALEQFEKALGIITNSIREESDNISTLLACVAETKQKMESNS
jgi:tetratricopeptide (TPR) repeat protein